MDGYTFFDEGFFLSNNIERKGGGTEDLVHVKHCTVFIVRCQCLKGWKLIIIKCGFLQQKNCAFLLQEDISKLSELITFKSRKTTISFTLLNNKDFKGNHCKW